MVNLALPGNPRYQPKDTIPFFGYDNIARYLVEVELAALDTLAARSVISADDYALLTPEVRAQLFLITTTEMDELERAVTKHDIRALVMLMQRILPEPLRRWVHVPLTSYDVIDSARALQFVRAHQILRKKIHRLIGILRDHARTSANIVQIGRTHGQHALPITVGFWFATILNRLLFNAAKMDEYAAGLVGKISGAVGAYNAQFGLGITASQGSSFEAEVLRRLGLNPGTISTQIVQPEPLAYYLFSALMLSGALGQLGRDVRQLMRSEIGELSEPFEKDQVGSSTMAHKRNPLNYENLEGTFFKDIAEFMKVLLTMVSEHQRDLVGSCVSRDFPTIIVNVFSQLDVLLREDKAGVPFLARLTVNEAACRRNFEMSGDRILAEPLYLALQMHGYAGDAHHLINHKAMPLVNDHRTLVEAVEELASKDEALMQVWRAIPPELHELFRDPERYVGRAGEKVEEVCRRADIFLHLE